MTILITEPINTDSEAESESKELGLPRVIKNQYMKELTSYIFVSSTSKMVGKV